MDLSHLVGKRIVSALTLPDCEIMFLVDEKKQLFELLPGEPGWKSRSIRCFISVTGVEALQDAVVTQATPTAVISQPIGKKWASLAEHIIVTEKGGCRITTGIFMANENEKCPISVVPVKGFPPQESVSMANFTRCFKDVTNDGLAQLRDEDLPRMQQRLSKKAGRTERTFH